MFTTFKYLNNNLGKGTKIDNVTTHYRQKFTKQSKRGHHYIVYIHNKTIKLFTNIQYKVVYTVQYGSKRKS